MESVTGLPVTEPELQVGVPLSWLRSVELMDLMGSVRFTGSSSGLRVVLAVAGCILATVTVNSRVTAVSGDAEDAADGDAAALACRDCREHGGASATTRSSHNWRIGWFVDDDVCSLRVVWLSVWPAGAHDHLVVPGSDSRRVSSLLAASHDYHSRSCICSAHSTTF